MPANLPPEYFAVERLYREAKSPEDKAKYLEELISTIPKHKGTDKLRAEYRKKLAKLKTAVQSSKKTGKHISQFHIEKEGDGRAVITGFANTGKSSLLALLTSAEPEISDVPYSTWLPHPGMLEYKRIQIQLIDTPPLDREFLEPELFELIKTSDAIIILLDLQADPIEQFQRTIDILNEHKVFSPFQEIPADVSHPSIIPFLIAVNKDDDDKLDQDFEVFKELLKETWSFISISVKQKKNIELFIRELLKQMKIIRVFAKPPGRDADLNKPFVLKEGNTVHEFALKVHHDFASNLKTARVWGKDVFDGQMVGKEHVLYDGDIVELHL